MIGAGPRPTRAVVRRDGGTWALQSALDRQGLGPVAGVDEAGRGACAGPLVVAACVLRPNDGARLRGLTDSKLLAPDERERIYDLLLRRTAGYAVIVVPTAEVDRRGVHVANLEGMRRAVAALDPHPGYVLTDGFPVPGLTAPSVSVVRGDRAAACVAAASVLAKVSRDHLMRELHERFPRYGFADHKGYGTSAHGEKLRQHGPCVEHRWSYANVAAAARGHGLTPPRPTQRSALSVAQRVNMTSICETQGGDVVQNGEQTADTAGGLRQR